MKIYSRFFSKNILLPDNLFYVGLLIIAVGLPLSKFLMSVGQIVMILAWLLLGNYQQLILNFFKNKTAVLVSSLFFLHIAGLVFTTDFTYAYNDMRIKLPILLLPILFSSFKPLSLAKFKWLFYVLSMAVLLATLIGLTRYFGFFEYKLIDKREISVFISHVRFGLLMVISIASLVYFFRMENKTTKIIIVFAILWLCMFMLFVGFITGICVLLLFLIVYLLKKVIAKYSIYRGVSIMLLVAIVIVPTYFLHYILKDYQQINKPKKISLLNKTDSGEYYFHDLKGKHKDAMENGYLIYRNIAWNELKATWNSRGNIKFDSIDLNNQQIKNTLIRYLTSKGLNKDENGVKALDDMEVKAIENGIANVNYVTQSALITRLHEIFWEVDNYLKGRDFNGHSIIMRWVYWKTGFDIFKENFLFGVGTGDVQNEFQNKYEINNSILETSFRLRAHNQFLTFALTFGILGLLLFIFILFYPLFKLKLYNRFIYLAFFVIVFASFFTEDTLESQAGVTFYIFMHSVLCWVYPLELIEER